MNFPHGSEQWSIAEEAAVSQVFPNCFLFLFLTIIFGFKPSHIEIKSDKLSKLLDSYIEGVQVEPYVCFAWLVKNHLSYIFNCNFKIFVIREAVIKSSSTSSPTTKALS